MKLLSAWRSADRGSVEWCYDEGVLYISLYPSGDAETAWLPDRTASERFHRARPLIPLLWERLL